MIVPVLTSWDPNQYCI